MNVNQPGDLFERLKKLRAVTGSFQIGGLAYRHIGEVRLSFIPSLHRSRVEQLLNSTRIAQQLSSFEIKFFEDQPNRQGRRPETMIAFVLFERSDDNLQIIRHLDSYPLGDFYLSCRPNGFTNSDGNLNFSFVQFQLIEHKRLVHEFNLQFYSPASFESNFKRYKEACQYNSIACRNSASSNVEVNRGRHVMNSNETYGANSELFTVFERDQRMSISPPPRNSTMNEARSSNSILIPDTASPLVNCSVQSDLGSSKSFKPVKRVGVYPRRQTKLAKSTRQFWRKQSTSQTQASESAPDESFRDIQRALQPLQALAELPRIVDCVTAIHKMLQPVLSTIERIQSRVQIVESRDVVDGAYQTEWTLEPRTIFTLDLGQPNSPQDTIETGQNTRLPSAAEMVNNPPPNVMP